jgi:RHS repeat-associated protein
VIKHSSDSFNGRSDHYAFAHPHNPFTFTGQELDEHTALYEFYARAYDPYTGSWLQQDLYRGVISRPSSLHRYGYVENGPTNWADWYGFVVKNNSKQTKSSISRGHGYRKVILDVPFFSQRNTGSLTANADWAIASVTMVSKTLDFFDKIYKLARRNEYGVDFKDPSVVKWLKDQGLKTSLDVTNPSKALNELDKGHAVIVNIYGTYAGGKQENAGVPHVVVLTGYKTDSEGVVTDVYPGRKQKQLEKTKR